jgi:CRP-like cAMP-binding protein
LRAFLEVIEAPRTVAAGVDLVRDGSWPEVSTCLLSGFTFRHKHLQNGGRQILSFQIAGDVPDLHSYILKRMDHNVTTLSACTVGTIPHHRLKEVTEQYPNLTRALWRDTMMESAIFREWLIGVGRRPAIARVAHLLCEQFYRMRLVGLADENSITLPITQTDLADSLGLSLVHANRTLQELRGLSLLELKSKTLTILDWERLKELAEFEPSYLLFDLKKKTR